MSKRVFPVLCSVLLIFFMLMTARGQTVAPVPSWNPSTRAAATHFGEFIYGLDSLVLNQDGSRILLNGFDHGQDGAQLWDVPRKKVLHTFEVGVNSKSFLAFTLDDSQVFVDSYVVDLSKNRAVRFFDLTQYTPYYAVATNPRGTRLLGYQDDILKLWDLGTGRALQSFGRVAIASSSTMALSTDGSRVAVADEQRQVQVWDSGSGKLLQRFPSGMDVLSTVTFSPDGSKLLLGGRVTPFWPVEAVVVKVWDLRRQSWAGQYKAPFGVVVKVAMSADGSRILAGHHLELSIGFWPALQGEYPTHERYRVLMWDTRTGARSTLVEQIQPIRSVTPLAFSADGSTVATELGDGVWVFKP